MTSTPATTIDDRSKGFRAVLLLIVWVLPGLWCAGHLLAHALEHEDHGPTLAIAAGDGIATVSHRHDHGHTHPETTPVVSTGGTKELASPALLAAAIELEASTATLQWRRDSVLRNPARRAAAASGPRAPPIA